MFDDRNLISKYIKTNDEEVNQQHSFVSKDGIATLIKQRTIIDTKPYVDSLIISDVHIGSPVSRSAELVKLIEHYDFRQLILNGDIFDDLNLKRFKDNDWDFIRYLRTISKDKNKKVVWVIGNHDGRLEYLSDLLGIEIHQEYYWKYEGKTYLTIHGHQFDKFLNEHILISNLSSWIYYSIQKLDGNKQRLSRLIKRTSKAWLKLSQKVGLEALNYARVKNVDFIICGHTHQAFYQTDGSITYLNSGCWTDTPAHYITSDIINGIKINEY